MTQPIINTKSGRIKGTERTNENQKKYYSFKGIPYGEPPVGKLRFKAPLPVKPWNDIKDALETKNIPVQIDVNDNKVVGEEDCLYLNIYTPSLPEKSDEGSLPVMVYIYGGGFKNGSGDEEEFGPEFIIERDVVLVVMNYRINIFGFLCLDTLEVPGNAGLKDQNLALTWIKENIKNFNGNGANITLFGTSAGAASVEYHTLSPLSVGLFHKAIMMSGSVLNPWSRNRHPKRFVKTLLKELNISELNPVVTLERLQELEIEDIINAASKVEDDEAVKEGTLFGFGPVIEKSFENVNAFLTVDPIESMKRGNYMKIPTIAGFCKDEGSMYQIFYNETNLKKLQSGKYTEYMKDFNFTNKCKIDSQLASVYNSQTNDKKRVDDFLSDFLFVSGITNSLKYRMKYDPSNYCYMFGYNGSLKYSYPGKDLTTNEVHHASEWSYLTKDFDNFTSPNENDVIVRNYLLDLWTNFAKTGNPTPSEFNFEWNPVEHNNLNVLLIDKTLEMIPFPWPERKNIWEPLY